MEDTSLLIMLSTVTRSFSLTMEGPPGLRRRWWPLQILLVLVMVLCLASCSTAQVETPKYISRFLSKQLDVLQKLRAAWSVETPPDELAGWNASQRAPCDIKDLRRNNENFDENFIAWRGVECMHLYNETSGSFFIRVSSLTLDNAFIHGKLPDFIWSITTFTTLELTGNPALTGKLPIFPQGPSANDESLGYSRMLNTLDLHNNGFDGIISPDTFKYLNNLKILDLSGNHFTGQYPLDAFKKLNNIRWLSLARNNLAGSLVSNAFQSNTLLENLDLSGNQFEGPSPKFGENIKLRSLDMSNNSFNGSFPNLTMIPTLQKVNLQGNKFSGHIRLSSIFNKDYTTSIVLNLSDNFLTGDLPSWSEFGNLTELYLDKNSLNGTLNLISDFNNLKSLKILSLINNNIKEVYYNNTAIGNFTTSIRLQGNPFCEGDVLTDDGKRCFCLQLCLHKKDIENYNSAKVIIIATTLSVASVIGLIIVAIILLWKNKRYQQHLLSEFQSRFSELDVKPTIFSYNQLRQATKNFDLDMKLGEGGFGVVYKGILSKGDIIAVKKLNVRIAKGIDEFLNEVILITGMKHRNLVSLKGCCLRGEDRLLVYEYVENGDVEQMVLNSGNVDIGWAIRLNICIGVAHGLYYLHALAQPRIIHRDIKASNILLDKVFAPKIADFGIALLFPEEKTHLRTMHIAGTKGYMAPEYCLHGQLCEKIDVYSFGILCLEVVSGRKNTDSKLPAEQMVLANWAWILFEENRLMELVDPTLNLHIDERLEVHQTINVALLCIQTDPEKRPTMARVVAMLQRDMASEEVVPIPHREVELPLVRKRKLTSSSSTSFAYAPSNDSSSNVDEISEVMLSTSHMNSSSSAVLDRTTEVSDR